MRYVIAFCVAASLALFGLAASPEDSADQAQLKKLWPADVEFPAGLKAYKRTGYSQRIAVTNNSPSNNWYRLLQHDYWTNSPMAANPNSHAPYAVPGGLENVKGWQSLTAITVVPSKVPVRNEVVPVFNGTPVPKYRWTFPDDTVVVDILSRDGWVFEIRTLEKREGKWVGRTPYVNKLARPAGYTGPGKSCAECHVDAGASLQYGITVRGDDNIFSWNPFIEGAFQRKAD